MPKQVTISYIDAPNDLDRQNRIIEILAEGLYAYLKNKNLLRNDLESTEKIKTALNSARQISQKISEENAISKEIDIG